MHAHINDSLVNIDNYFLVRNDREGKEGWGVACYIHEPLKAQVLAASPSTFTNSPEYLIISIQCDNSQLLLCASAYRHPKRLLFSDFISDFSKHAYSYNNIILSGDLNCNFYSNNFEAQFLRDFIFSSAIFLVPSAAKFHTAILDSWLDLMILDHADKLVSFVKCEVAFICGHDILQLSYAVEMEHIHPRARRCVRHLNLLEYASTIASLLLAGAATNTVDASSGDVELRLCHRCRRLSILMHRSGPFCSVNLIHHG